MAIRSPALTHDGEQHPVVPGGGAGEVDSTPVVGAVVLACPRQHQPAQVLPVGGAAGDAGPLPRVLEGTVTRVQAVGRNQGLVVFYWAFVGDVEKS